MHDPILVGDFLDRTLKAAIAELKDNVVPVYTFAFCYWEADGSPWSPDDYQAAFVSVFVDTKEASQEIVRQMNSHTHSMLCEAIHCEDLKNARNEARSFLRRSMGIGDFAFKSIAEAGLCEEILDGDMELRFKNDYLTESQNVILEMIRSVQRFEAEIIALSPCSDEVEFLIVSGAKVVLGWPYSAEFVAGD